MPRRITDIVEIIVLTACSNATLAASRSRITAILAERERLLKLHHACIRK